MVVLYADDILICLSGRGVTEVSYLRSLIYDLRIFGFFAGLWVTFDKTVAVLKISDPDTAMPLSIARITMKPSFKYLGVLLGNVTASEAYAPALAKMLARAGHWPRYHWEWKRGPFFCVVHCPNCVPHRENVFSLRTRYFLSASSGIRHK